MEPYLSIVVPVYKVEQYLYQCIDSILAQTFKDFELILVDDGSPDNCPKICDEYALRDPRIKVIHKINGGHTSARKEGLRVARGEYVGFVDSDDWIEEDMYESLCRATADYNADFVICDLIYNLPEGEVRDQQGIKPGVYNKKSLENDVYPYMLYSGNFYSFGILPGPCNKIFRRTLLNNNLFRVNEAILVGEDAAFIYPCLLDSSIVCILNNRFLYHYRQTATSITKRYDPEFLKKSILLYKYLKQVFSEKKAFYMERQLNYYLLFLVLIAIDREYMVKNQRDSIAKKNLLSSIISNEDTREMIKRVSLNKLSLRTWLYTLLLKLNRCGILHVLVSFINIIKPNKEGL